MLAVEDGDFGVWGNALQLGAGLNGHRLAKARRDGAGLLHDFDDGGGFTDANDAAVLAGILDNVTGSECVRVGHNLVEG